MTDARLPSTWPRDVTLLRHVAQRLDADPAGSVSTMDLDPEAAGLTAADLIPAGVALLSGRYLVGKVHQSCAGIRYVSFWGLTERGRRAAGLWPGEDVVASLVAALEAAENSPDTPEADRPTLRKTRELIGSLSRDVLSGILAEIVTGGEVSTPPV